MQQAATHLMRAYARQPVTFARARRAPVGRAGVEYLDAIAGVAVTSLGHGHPEIAAAIAEQAALLMHTSNVFRVEWQERLGQRCARWPGWKGRSSAIPAPRPTRPRSSWRACTAIAARRRSRRSW